MEKNNIPIEQITENGFTYWVKGSNSTPLPKKPLQNGERERIIKLMLRFSMSLKRQDSLVSARDISNEMKVSESIIDEVLDLLSQSKKESYQSGCEDMLRDTCAKITLFIESESGKSGRKEILKFVKSLTNQKKDI